MDQKSPWRLPPRQSPPASFDSGIDLDGDELEILAALTDDQVPIRMKWGSVQTLRRLKRMGLIQVRRWPADPLAVAVAITEKGISVFRENVG